MSDGGRREGPALEVVEARLPRAPPPHDAAAEGPGGGDDAECPHGARDGGCDDRASGKVVASLVCVAWIDLPPAAAAEALRERGNLNDFLVVDAVHLARARAVLRDVGPERGFVRGVEDGECRRPEQLQHGVSNERRDERSESALYVEIQFMYAPCFLTSVHGQGNVAIQSHETDPRKFISADM